MTACASLPSPWLDAILKKFSGLRRRLSQPAQRWSLRAGGAQRATTAKAARWKARYPVFTDIKQEGDFARAY
jgi:tagatose 1,6-diphosphate aldolase